MGTLKQDVRDQHLRIHPQEMNLLKPFLFNFDVNYARRIDIQNTQFSAYILSPDRLMREGFAFTEELLLVISSFRRMQPRTVQGVERIINTAPFKGRIDPLTYFLVSDDDDVEEWTNNYLMNHPQARTPIPFSFNSIEKMKSDRWFIRNQLAVRLYNRDLFDYQLPLDDDLFFFGRKQIADEFVDGIRKGQNRGLFGLRKTGKTSFLFKLMRTCTELNIAKTVYIDCKRPDIRGMDWNALLDHVATELSAKAAIKVPATKEPVKKLIKLAASSPNGGRLCIIFDEIEYISPLAHLDTHWKADFVPFWQTLWSIQSEHRNITFIVAGVNPYLCEEDLIGKTQNPMFGIVKTHYLTGLARDDIAQMVKSIGGRMGLGFEDSAINYIYNRYGGHPLLSRMACSYTNQSIAHIGASRPVSIKDSRLKSEQDDREEVLRFYCRHVISEMREFYPDEYSLLEMLSSGEVADFNEFAAEPSWISHLKSYGIITISEAGRPTFSIPVIQRFVAAERARKDKNKDLRYFLPAEKRQDWVDRRKFSIIHDMKMLLKLIGEKGAWQPFGAPVLPEADLLQRTVLCVDWVTFNAFINDLNKCLVESIDNAHPRGAFFNTCKINYPDLFEALLRIRLLRNNADHLRLNRQVEDGLRALLARDLYDRSITQISDPWFALQQITFDELFSAIQYEINRLT